MKKNILAISSVLIFCVQLSYSQISEKIGLYVSGGGTMPVESIVGKTFEFPQLSRDTDSDFFTEVLGREADSKNIQNYWKTGFNVGGGLRYDINSILAVSADFNYNLFRFDANQLAGDVGNTLQEIPIDPNMNIPYNPDGLTISQGSLNIYEFSVNVRAQFPLERIRPYILGGAGYMRVNQDVISLSYYDDFNIPPLPQQGNVSFYDQIPAATYDAVMLNAGAGLAVKLSKNLQPFVQVSYVLGLTEGNDTILYPVKFGFLFTLK
ncbi:MAG: outer membrane beta-barrel protein [bacterium]|nr:MAG: outer membrane beta-barrel protein [bacterium]